MMMYERGDSAASWVIGSYATLEYIGPPDPRPLWQKRFELFQIASWPVTLIAGGPGLLAQDILIQLGQEQIASSCARAGIQCGVVIPVGGFSASKVLHKSELDLLPKAAPGTYTIVLGHYFLPGEVYDFPGLGPRNLSNQPIFLNTVLRPAAIGLGGRTFEHLPGDIEIMKREIIKADRIVFFTRPDMQGLTMQEMEFIQSHSELREKTIFILGGLVEEWPRIR